MYSRESCSNGKKKMGCSNKHGVHFCTLDCTSHGEDRASLTYCSNVNTCWLCQVTKVDGETCTVTLEPESCNGDASEVTCH